jgi:hypothetical protein
MWPLATNAPMNYHRGHVRAGDVEACHERLHRAGWSIGEVGTKSGWLVTGSNGEHVIRALASTQAGAWRLACEQAAALGLTSACLR